MIKSSSKEQFYIQPRSILGASPPPVFTGLKIMLRNDYVGKSMDERLCGDDCVDITTYE